MPTLIVASRSVAYDRALAEAASSQGWPVIACDRDSLPAHCDDPVLYVSTDLALAAANRLGVGLIEPTFDLLARVPKRFTRRAVESARFSDLVRLHRPTFVKPADPLDKWFDAGIYSDSRMIRTRGQDRPESIVLLSEPVEWSAEFRCFVLEGCLVEWSPYLSFGRPVWKAANREKSRRGNVPGPVREVVFGLCSAMKGQLPPAFVVDVGLIEQRGWAVVEFNPVWCAGLLGGEGAKILPILRRAMISRRSEDSEDCRWLVSRTKDHLRGDNRGTPPESCRTPLSDEQSSTDIDTSAN